jgi:hypothetical protein
MSGFTNNMSLIPIGGIILWNDIHHIPYGFSICDGRTENGITTPNLKGKFVMGHDASNNHLDCTDNSGGSFFIENDDLQAYQYQFENDDIRQYLLGGTPVIDKDYTMPYYVLVYIQHTSVSQPSDVVPTTSTDDGHAGQISVDDNYMYVCIAPGSWKRVAFDEW